METVYENNPERAEIENLRDALDYVYRKLEAITADSYTDIWKDCLLIFISSVMYSSYKHTGEEMIFPNPYYPPYTTTQDLHRWGILDDTYDDEDEDDNKDYFDELAWEVERDEQLFKNRDTHA